MVAYGHLFQNRASSLLAERWKIATVITNTALVKQRHLRGYSVSPGGSEGWQSNLKTKKE